MSAADVHTQLAGAVVIPAHPLALDAQGCFDERAQRALTRYYLDAGAHGLAVGVHTTQFELHDDQGQLAAVWQLAAEQRGHAGTDPVLVAGSVLPYAQLSEGTRTAWLAACAGMASLL